MFGGRLPHLYVGGVTARDVIRESAGCHMERIKEEEIEWEFVTIK